MKQAIFLALITLIGALTCYAQDADTFQLDSRNQTATAAFQAWKCDNPKGALVIIPAFPEVPSDSDTAEINEWKAYASANSLGLAFVNLTLNRVSPLNPDKSLNSIDGLSGLIKKGINQEYKTDVPIFLYARSDVANQDVLSMVSSDPNIFIGWYCSASPTFGSLQRLKTHTPPGIIACPTDSIWYDTTQKLFLAARSMQTWTWIPVKPIDMPNVRAFVGQYFLTLLNPVTGEWRKLSTHEVVEANHLNDIPVEDLTWMPDDNIGNSWAKLAVTRSVAPTIVMKEIKLEGENLPNIQIYLRIPNGAQDASGVDGVLAFCTWIQEKNNLVQQLTTDPDQPEDRLESPSVQMVRFAAKHNLALLTWSTPGKWAVGQNSDEISDKDQADIDREFDLFAAAWDKGISQLCTEYKLPEDKYLLFGMSRGAQWAHRLALRDAKRFLAVNAHVSSSYDMPTPEGKNFLWLITSGELDPGLRSSKLFYAQCQKLGYPMLFKAPVGLGHEMRSDVDALRNAFFEYALSLKKAGQNSPIDVSGLISLQNAKFIGDYENQKVVPADKADQIKAENQVFLPTEALSVAWQTPPPPAPVVSVSGTSSSPSPASGAALKESVSLNNSSTNTVNLPSAVAITPVVQDSAINSTNTASDKPQTATVISVTKIETTTPSGGYASMPLDVGAKLTIVSINADGTVTAISEFHFKGQVQQKCITIDKP